MSEKRIIKTTVELLTIKVLQGNTSDKIRSMFFNEFSKILNSKAFFDDVDIWELENVDGVKFRNEWPIWRLLIDTEIKVLKIHEFSKEQEKDLIDYVIESGNIDIIFANCEDGLYDLFIEIDEKSLKFSIKSINNNKGIE